MANKARNSGNGRRSSRERTTSSSSTSLASRSPTSPTVLSSGGMVTLFTAHAIESDPAHTVTVPALSSSAPGDQWSAVQSPSRPPTCLCQSPSDTTSSPPTSTPSRTSGSSEWTISRRISTTSLPQPTPWPTPVRLSRRRHCFAYSTRSSRPGTSGVSVFNS